MLIPETPNYERIRMRDARRIEPFALKSNFITLSMSPYSCTATLLYLDRFFCLLDEFVKPRILPNCVPPRVQA